MKSEADEPTIGLLLCKSKNALVAEYALRTTSVPLGIADYQLVESLPKDLDASLPSIARIEEELGGPRQPKTARRARAGSSRTPGRPK